jgi:Fis family transcriptional regulator
LKEQLEKLVLTMYRSGIKYSEAIEEFQKVFLLTVLRENQGNQVRAARELRVHRNTLRRTAQAFGLDVRQLRSVRRRPPVKAHTRNGSGKTSVA